MDFKANVSTIGSYLLGTVIIIALISLPVLFIMGSVIIGDIIMPWLLVIATIILAFNIVILVPMTLFSKMRPWAGIGFYISSYIFGLTGWFMGLILTWFLWGYLAVVIGLFVMGVGVVPIAMIATFLNGLWIELGFLLITSALTIGLRIFGLNLTENT